MDSCGVPDKYTTVFIKKDQRMGNYEAIVSRYFVQLCFTDEKYYKFEEWLKTTPRKIKKHINRIAYRGPSICQTLGIDENSFEVSFSTEYDSKLHKYLKRCSNELVKQEAVSAKKYEYPVFIRWYT